jgi:DNA-binding winged helix-turn-helix (wHTH) protein
MDDLPAEFDVVLKQRGCGWVAAKVLLVLWHRRERLMHSEVLMAAVYGGAREPNTLRMAVRSLRLALSSASAPWRVSSYPGRGYSLEEIKDDS